MFSPPYRSPQNPQELTRVTMLVIRVEPGQYGFNSVWTRLEIRLCVTVAKITTHSAHFDPHQIRIVTMNAMRYTTRVDAVLQCVCKRVGVVRTGSIQILIQNWYPCKKFWTWPKKLFRSILVTESSGIDTDMRVYTGKTGSIRFWYRMDPVWNLAVCDFSIVTRFDPCGSTSNSWFTRTDPCRPATANIKEKLVKLGQ
jgi:hypothetical protein